MGRSVRTVLLTGKPDDGQPQEWGILVVQTTMMEHACCHASLAWPSASVPLMSVMPLMLDFTSPLYTRPNAIALPLVGAGLSHVAEEIEKEGIVPASAFDFLTHGYAVGMRANDVECESSQDREVLRTIVFSGSVAILVEHDVEYPMQPVLDTPMTAHNLQQSLGGDVLGKQVIAHGRLVGPPAMEASARGDAGHGNDTRKAVCSSHVGVANDGGAPRRAVV